jgi:MoaA/NifB/PqqE/SkfB family radical SAM enzyme
MNFRRRMYKSIYVEPTSICQVKCAVCPVYKPVDSGVPPLNLTVELADKISTYCSQELGSNHVAFGNWGEPFLNKELLDIVRQFTNRKYLTVVNSNFSLDIDTEKLMSENIINRINISMSGLTNDIYNIYHRLGDIEIVLNNINDALKFRKKYKSKTNIVVKWHRFKHNEKQLKEAKKYFSSLGVRFYPYHAHMGCIEHIKGYMTERDNMDKDLLNFIEGSVHTDFLMKKCMSYSSPPRRCHQQNFVTIHCDGHILYCCALYSSYLYRSKKPIFKMTKGEVRKFKNTHLDFCKECFELGIATYFHKSKA